MIAILIPAFNEAASVGEVVASIPAELHGLPVRVLVVDDGSSDGTPAVARAAGAEVLVLEVNQGGGAALRSGFAFLAGEGVEFVATMDADGQHLASDLPEVLGPVVRGEADLVVGSRRLGRGEGPLIRRAGVVAFSALVSGLLRTRVTDVSSGLRGIRLPIVSQLRLEQQQHHTAELLVEAIRRGFRVVEVPIQVVERRSGETKKGRTLPYAWRFGRSILTTWARP